MREKNKTQNFLHKIKTKTLSAELDIRSIKRSKDSMSKFLFFYISIQTVTAYNWRYTNYL